MTGNGHNTPEELAAFAMQSLPGEEAASMKVHLDSCPECREEL
jgi:anti-sigma factor RsiW